MSRLSKSIIATLGAAMLASCTLGPDFTRPAAPDVKGYAMPGDNGAPPGVAFISAPVAASTWWRSLGSPDLDAVTVKALAGNQDLAAADATLAEAQAEEQGARGGSLPSVNASAGFAREKINTTSFGFAGFPSPTITLYSIGGAIAYDLDIFGGRKRSIEGAAARSEAESQRAQAAYLTLTGRVAQQAILIATLRAEIAAVESVIADDRSNLDAVKRALAAGGAPASATVTAETELDKDVADLPPLKQRLAEARHGLALLVGRPPAVWTAPDFDLASFRAPGSVPVSLPSELVRHRPDILAAESDLHAALADVGVAEAERYPKISLNAALTQSALSSADIFKETASGWNIGGGLTAPLFHGGALRANQTAKEAAARRALARYRQTVLQAFVQVANVLQALIHDEEETQALQRAEASAAKNLSNARLGFEKGGWPYINVLDAQRLHGRAVQDLAAAQGKQLADIALLYVATAADWRAAPILSANVTPSGHAAVAP